MMADFIALDRETTCFRAYHVRADGCVRDMIAAAEGILAVKDGAFQAALEQHIGARDVKPPELAGLYLINGKERPVWPGFAPGKEYAGHTTERQTLSLSPTGLYTGGEGGVRGSLRVRELFWKSDDAAAREVFGRDSRVDPLTLPSPPVGERDDRAA